MLKSLVFVLALPLTLAAQDPKKPAEAAKAPAPPAAATAAPAAAPDAKAAKAPAPAEKTSASTELKVGTGVEKKEIVGAASEFKVAADTKIWAWARLAGLPAEAKVTLVTLTFTKGEKEAFRKELTAAGSPWRVNAYKTFRAADGGDWTARLLGPDGAELATAKFKVEIAK